MVLTVAVTLAQHSHILISRHGIKLPHRSDVMENTSLIEKEQERHSIGVIVWIFVRWKATH